MKLVKELVANEISVELAKELLSGVYEHFGTMDGSSRIIKNGLGYVDVRYFKVDRDPKMNYGLDYSVGRLLVDDNGCTLFSDDIYGSMLSSSPLQRVESIQFFLSYEVCEKMSELGVYDINYFNKVRYYDEYFRKDSKVREELGVYAKAKQFVLG
tara:strand:- start:1746 stop:2210 length:465 start_codon:yes stop_codon:yes gene_type:complete